MTLLSQSKNGEGKQHKTTYVTQIRTTFANTTKNNICNKNNIYKTTRTTLQLCEHSNNNIRASIHA